MSAGCASTCRCVSRIISAAKPIDIINLHSPASAKHPLIPTVREHILQWLIDNTSSGTIIGGDLNSSPMSLDNGLKKARDFRYLFEPNYKHGDIMLVRGLNAESTACDVGSTSDAHKMCCAMVKQEIAAPPDAEPADSAAKPAEPLVSNAAEPATQMQRAENAASIAMPVTPLADALFKLLGQKLDDQLTDEERQFYSELADQLWSGDRPGNPPGLPASSPVAAKMRLQTMMAKALEW